MGGAIELVSSTLGMAQDVSSLNKQESTATAQLRAEREAQEAEQLEQEAGDRRKKRQQVTEARDVQRKRLAGQNSGQTTLMNGGAGLVEDPNVFVPTLKDKFGE